MTLVPIRPDDPPPVVRAGRIVPLIIATALLMENIDSSVLATSLPQIARDLNSDPIHLKLVMTTYLLALAVFIPASGWAADRFGAQRVFRLAIVVFAAGSIACALSSTLPELVGARTLQGIGGSMMTPVGRLIVLRASPRAGLVGALAWLTVPALLGPVIGPPLGGFITTYYDWRWIFWINIPIAALGVGLATAYVPDLRETAVSRFDVTGFFLLGPGLAAFLTGATLLGLSLASTGQVLALTGLGLGLILAYVRHALRVSAPMIDLRLLAVPTFRASVTGGTLLRVGIGALPFLLPLMLQFGFGLTPFQSGMLTFASGVGAMAMKFIAQPLLRAFGFRRVMMVNAVLSSGFILAPAFFTPQTSWLWMAAVLFVGGLSRSLQFTSVNAFAYADVPSDRLSSASSFNAVLQQLSGSIGITLAAMGLETMQRIHGGAATDLANFPYIFAGIAALSLMSAFIFARIPRDAGASLLARAG
jgi:EmrB/QacA subfamily drug resistance transporter